MNIRPAPRTEYPRVINDSDDNSSLAIISLILGIAGIFLVLFPPLLCAAGFFSCIIGIILGINALKSRAKLLAMAGIGSSGIGIVIFILNLVYAQMAGNLF